MCVPLHAHTFIPYTWFFGRRRRCRRRRRLHRHRQHRRRCLASSHNIAFNLMLELTRASTRDSKI